MFRSAFNFFLFITCLALPTAIFIYSNIKFSAIRYSSHHDWLNVWIADIFFFFTCLDGIYMQQYSDFCNQIIRKNISWLNACLHFSSCLTTPLPTVFILNLSQTAYNMKKRDKFSLLPSLLYWPNAHNQIHP